MAREPNWSRAELAVIRRAVSGLREGRYPTARAATRVCVAELAHLRLQPRVLRQQSPARSKQAVYAQVRTRAVAAGVSAYAPWWKSEESRVVARYGRALARGRYAELAVAAKECREEWNRLRRLRPDVFRARTLLALSNAVRAAAYKLGWHTSSVHRDPRVDRILMRHARSLAHGRYRSGNEAARHCAEELTAFCSRHPAVPRLSVRTVARRIWQKCHGLGMPIRRPDWTADEDELVQRYARAVVEGRYSSGTQAAESCIRDLARLPRAQERTRRLRDVNARIVSFTHNLGYPRPHGGWTASERAVLERHARAVIAGRHSSAAAAAKACYRELTRHYRQLREAGRLRSLAGRSAGTVLGRMHERVRELGQRGPTNRRWSEEEKKAAARWLRWYDRQAKIRRLRPLGQAAEGLQQDIEDMGGTRSLGACEARLYVDRMRAIGMA